MKLWHLLSACMTATMPAQSFVLGMLVVSDHQSIHWESCVSVCYLPHLHTQPKWQGSGIDGVPHTKGLMQGIPVECFSWYVSGQNRATGL